MLSFAARPLHAVARLAFIPYRQSKFTVTRTPWGPTQRLFATVPMAYPGFTAACCIIGDEILNGKTRDSNAFFLAKYLFDLGIDLKRVEVIGDDYDAIAETVQRLSSAHDIVFTSGGIGPTHDDITYDALARAYGLPLKLDEETCDLMKKSATSSHWTLTEERKRMAIFPHPAEILRETTDFWVPVVVVNKNVHVLPGIPKLFEGLLASLRPHFESLVEAKNGALTHYYRVQIATSLPEGEIAPYLTTVQARVKESHIKIGSYPKWGDDTDGVRVVVSIVGKDQDRVQSIGKEIAQLVKGWTYESPSPSSSSSLSSVSAHKPSS